MKLKNKYGNPSATIDYKLDTGDGEFALSTMPATVAEEIAKRSKKVALVDDRGFELSVDGGMRFPKDIFEFEDGELGESEPPRRGGRPTKAELLEEAGKEMTNPQLHHAIEEAKQEKAQKRSGK